MKKLILSLSLACVFTASAAWEEIGSLQVAGTDGIVASVNKFAELSGNAMLGGMFSGAIMKSKVVDFFGPTRNGASVLLRGYVEGDLLVRKVAEYEARKAKGEKFESSDLKGCFGWSAVYPVIATKAKFLKHHKGAVETNGVIRIEDSVVLFSSDGKWAAFAENEAMAKLALSDMAEAEKPLGGNLARLAFTPRGMKVLRKHVEEYDASVAKPEDKVERWAKDVLNGIDSVEIFLKVSDLGIEVGGVAMPVPGTELAKIGLKQLDLKKLDAFGKEVIVVSGYAADSGRADQTQHQWEDILAMLKRHDIELSFVSRKQIGSENRFTIDVGDIASNIVHVVTNNLQKLDKEKLSADYKAICNKYSDRPFSAKSAESFDTVVFTGIKGGFTPSERLKATMPDVASRKPFYVAVFSYYSMLRGMLPIILDCNEDTKELKDSFMALLPPEAAGGIVNCSWRDGDALNGRLRISPDEIKSLAGSVTAVMTFAAMQRQGEESDDDDDESDDADED